jgi:hypothetical protein
VAGEDDLPPLLRPPDLGDDLQHNRIVELFFVLIGDERERALREQRLQQDRRLLPGRCVAKRRCIRLPRLIFENRNAFGRRERQRKPLFRFKCPADAAQITGGQPNRGECRGPRTALGAISFRRVLGKLFEIVRDGVPLNIRLSSCHASCQAGIPRIWRESFPRKPGEAGFVTLPDLLGGLQSA